MVRRCIFVRSAAPKRTNFLPIAPAYLSLMKIANVLRLGNSTTKTDNGGTDDYNDAANKTFYYALLIPLLFVAFQVLVWAVKENQLFVNRYAPYGFDWLRPHFFKMLFGFDAGFFIYTPLCFLFLFGLFALYKENKFLFYSVSAFLLGLFYFLSAYSAYTYYDGFGIRVLVDFYSVFALLGAKLLMYLHADKFLYITILAFALFFVVMNVMYSYQAKHAILPRAGITYNQWKYIFFIGNIFLRNQKILNRLGKMFSLQFQVSCIISRW